MSLKTDRLKGPHVTKKSSSLLLKLPVPHHNYIHMINEMIPQAHTEMKPIVILGSFIIKQCNYWDVVNYPNWGMYTCKLMPTHGKGISVISRIFQTAARIYNFMPTRGKGISLISCIYQTAARIYNLMPTRARGIYRISRIFISIRRVRVLYKFYVRYHPKVISSRWMIKFTLLIDPHHF